jgi:hypothetical protein
VALEGVADEPARGMLHRYEAVAKSALQRAEPRTIGMIGENDQGRSTTECSGDAHEGPPGRCRVVAPRRVSATHGSRWRRRARGSGREGANWSGQSEYVPI